MNKRLFVLALSAALLISFSSCKKKGCTDPTATNYDASAKVDDGSCTYPDSGTVTDSRDSQTYPWKKIGNQRWMTKNMNFDTNDSCWCYDDNPANCTIYGRLYSQAGAVEACPDGWHLPTDADWDNLVDGLGGNSVAGGELVVGGSSGFEAKYAGGRHPTFLYANIGDDGSFWTNTAAGGLDYFEYRVTSSSDTVIRNSTEKTFGYSCRCIKD